MDGDAEAWDCLLRALGDRPRKALDRALQQLRVVKQHARRLAADIHLRRPQRRSHRPQTGGISTRARALRPPQPLRARSCEISSASHRLKHGTTPSAEPADEPADDGHQVVVRRPRLVRHVAVPALWWSRRHRVCLDALVAIFNKRSLPLPLPPLCH